MENFVTGFSTGTFDMLHEGHYRILSYMKDQCDYLVIGLTTDEQIEIEKNRKPFFNYRQRERALLNTRHVDSVVANKGESKKLMYEKLRFDILFIGDDYFQSEDYMSMQNQSSTPKLIFIPRFPYTSTTELIAEHEYHVLSRLSVMREGVNGNVMELKSDGKRDVVIKEIRCSPLETIHSETISRTRDVFSMFNLNGCRLPRNWKLDLGIQHPVSLKSFPTEMEIVVPFPNFPGLNVHREIDGNRLMSVFNWCPFIENREVNRDLSKYKARDPGVNMNYEKTWSSIKSYKEMHKIQTTEEYMRRVLSERIHPSSSNHRALYWIIQKHTGQPLDLWLDRAIHQKNSLDTWRNVIVKQIVSILIDMRSMRIVHSDVHLGNLCFDAESSRVSLVDWGWCQHYSFDMSRDEREYYHLCLKENFDYWYMVNCLTSFFRERNEMRYMDVFTTEYDSMFKFM